MLKSLRCPNCQASTVITCHIVQANVVPPQWMLLSHTLNNGVALHPNHFSCWSCGHVWSSVAPEALRAYIEKHGTELIKERLGPLASDPHHDVPDCPEALEASQGVAEIDALVLEGKAVDATRRFRELTKTPWGPAGDAIRAWHTWKRAKKLWMFGWRTKDAIVDDKAVLGHPMRDPGWTDDARPGLPDVWRLPTIFARCGDRYS